MTEEIEFETVDFITIDTIGPPGQRVFHLQAGQGEQLLTVIIEKEQAAALANGISSILNDIQEKFNLTTPDPAKPLDMALREPILPRFRVGQIGLGYDNDNDRLVLMLSELQPEDSEGDQQIIRLRASRHQMRAMSNHTQAVVAGGRPICGNCGRPIDPEGHFCPKSNGHKKEIASA